MQLPPQNYAATLSISQIPANLPFPGLCLSQGWPSRPLKDTSRVSLPTKPPASRRFPSYGVQSPLLHPRKLFPLSYVSFFLVASAPRHPTPASLPGLAQGGPPAGAASVDEMPETGFFLKRTLAHHHLAPDQGHLDSTLQRLAL